MTLDDPTAAAAALPAEPAGLDPRDLTVRRAATALATPVVLVAAGAVARALGAGWGSATALAAASAALAGGVWWWVDGVRHRRWRWHVDRVAVVLSRGGIVRTTTTIPRFRLQHVDVSQGPIERRFGVATLTLHVAGRDAAHELPGLDAARAAAVRDALVRALHARWQAETAAPDAMPGAVSGAAGVPSPEADAAS